MLDYTDSDKQEFRKNGIITREIGGFWVCILSPTGYSGVLESENNIATTGRTAQDAVFAAYNEAYRRAFVAQTAYRNAEAAKNTAERYLTVLERAQDPREERAEREAQLADPLRGRMVP